VTWQTSAVRYVSIGEKSARFRDLVLSFDLDGDPVETVVWLPNGGGKSSLMSLKSAVVLPAARDFTGAGREDGEKRPRRLEDYVTNGDTAHTVIEWTRGDDGTLDGSRHRLLTGAVYEWPDRHRPGPDQSSGLNKLWWSAVPSDDTTGTFDLRNLPVRDRRLLTLNQFNSQLRALNTQHPELQIQVARTQNQWEEQLGRLGIDTALYRYQARMNTSEGGIAKVFNFNTVKDFIDLVVDVVANPQQADDCGRVVNEHAKNLFRRPVLQTERAFLNEAHVLLVELDAAHELVLAASAGRDQAQAHAVRLRSALNQAAGLHDSAARVAAGRATGLEQRAVELRRERGRVEAVRAELLFLAARTANADADRDLATAEGQEKVARVDHGAWTVAAALADAATHDRMATELREQLKPERTAREEFRVRVDTVALAAQHLLNENATDLVRRAKDAAARAGADRLHLKALDEALKVARGEVTDLDRTEAAAEARIKDHDRLLETARRERILGATETPGEALVRLQEEAEASESAAKTHEVAEGEHRTEARAASERLLTTSNEHSQLAADALTAHAEQEELESAHDRFATHERLIALAEANEVVNVWGDAARLRHALGDEIRESDDAALREAVGAAEDNRLVSGVDAAGLLPAPAATIAVARTLSAAGVPAETAWDVLARDYSEPDQERVTTGRPDIATGVVVQDAGARERALSLLVTDPALAHITLATSDELATAARGTTDLEPLPSVPLHEGLYLSDAAASAAARLRENGKDRRRRQSQLTDRARADRALLDGLSAFLATYPDNDSLELAAQATVTAREAAANKLAETHAHAKARDEHERLAGERRTLAGAANREAAQLRRHLSRLEALASAEAQMVEHRDSVRAAQVALVEVKGRIATLEGDRQVVADRVSQVDVERTNLERDARDAATRASQIRVLEPDTPPPAADVDAASERGLTDVVAAYDVLAEQWRAESGTSVLEARLSSAETSAEQARERAARALRSHDSADIDVEEVRTLAKIRAAGNASSQCETLASTARTALDSAIVATANAATALERTTEQLGTARTTRDRTQRVTDPVEFTTVEDARTRAATLLAQLGDLQAAADEAAAQGVQAAQVAKDEDALADNLRDQGIRLPAEPAPEDLGSVAPFSGGLDAARAAVLHAVKRLEDTKSEVDAAREQRESYTARAVRLGTGYAGLTLTLRERLTDSDATRLGAKAADYAGEVTTRLAHVEDLLGQIGEDEKRVSSLVSSHVSELLSSLSSAARASKLPAGLGELSGKQFINLRFHNPSDEELLSRVTQEILAMLDSSHGDTKSLPSGQQILRRCVHAAAGVKGFRVEVLKPNEHMLEQRVPVVDVARFSDGEKLTTCVLLFCAFARMRQQGRTGGVTGTLMLDNPFGRASNAQLVALQLAVAKAQRVHLVYATGLEDMGALLQFRRLIRLRNRKPVGTSDGHVQLESDTSARVGEVNGVTVARPTAPVPSGLTDSIDDVEVRALAEVDEAAIR
jgi:hypothetical protein